MRKAIALCVAMMLAVTALTGCGKTAKGSGSDEQAAAERKTMEMKQNDYRGGITRLSAIQDNILKVMDTMKGNNDIIREDSPNSFWYADGYQDFVATFLDIPLINDTKWFNEEEGDWETTLHMMCSEKNNFNTEGDEGGYVLACEVTRNEKDDYLVSKLHTAFTLLVNGRAHTYDTENTEDAQCRVLYDCDKDWCKAYLTQTIDEGIPDVTTQMIEYMRIDNDTFAVQTSRERLLVKLKPADKDTDIREREIKEFYYSKLVQEGMRTTFTPYLPLPEVDEAMGEVLDANVEHNSYMDSYKGFNEEGDIAILYGQHDSVFYRDPKDIVVPEKFVFEDKSLQQAICYKDGVLVVTTYNKLSKAYERFTYAMKEVDGKKVDSSIADELEKMVAINKLVGIQMLPDGDEAVTSEEDTMETEEVKDKTDKEEKTSEAKPEKEETEKTTEATTESATEEDKKDTENTEEKTTETQKEGTPLSEGETSKMPDDAHTNNGETKTE